MATPRALSSITSEAIHLEGKTIPRNAVEGAYFSPAAKHLPACVRLYSKRDRTLAEIAVASAEDADALLERLELGPSQRTARFLAIAPKGGASRWIGVVGLFGFAAMAAVGFAVESVVLAVMCMVLAVVASAGFLSSRVYVAADGLLVAPRLYPATFIPWSDVVAIEAADSGILVRCHRGALEVPIATGNSMRYAWAQAARHALFHRAVQALEAYRRREVPAAVARLGRQGRAPAEWLRDLRDREGSFREAPVLDEQLWSVVESSTAEPTARGGAAAMLARSASDGDRKRLRIAAEACAGPHLRVVLDQAASAAAEAELEEALLALAENEAKHDARS